MEWYREYSDSQYQNMCAYCGDTADTRDHVPSKILLDEPYNYNIPVVPCCNECNNTFSRDEEYFACAVECSKYMTTDLTKLNRIKVINALKRNTKLRNQLTNSILIQTNIFGDIEKSFIFDNIRMFRVINKLVIGHARYEHSTPFLNDPEITIFKRTTEMDKDELTRFETIPISNKITEVGSRSCNFLIENSEGVAYIASFWEVVQENHYEYLVYYNDKDNCVEVRIKLANTFCIQAILRN